MLNQSIVLKSADERLVEALSAIYRAFLRPFARKASVPNGSLEISVTNGSSGRSVRYRRRVTPCESFAELLYAIDKIVTVELQVRRPDLFFLHAAAVAIRNKAILLVGEPGAGKSTLCWSMCDAGYAYLSDELAPVNLEELKVEPFARAISLKSLPDCAPALPASTIDTGATMHVPTDALRRGYANTPLPIRAIIFLLPGGGINGSGPSPLSTSEAAARLYANGLNQLAHKDDGLEGAIRIAASTKCYSLERAELQRMLAAIEGLGVTDNPSAKHPF